MNRTLRGMIGCGFLSLLIVLSFGAIGCGGGGTKCTSNTDCTAPQTCNLTSGQCETAATGGCSADADCGENKVCDKQAGKSGTCFDKCAADTDCSEGSTCDATLQRCICKKDDCEKRDNGTSYACHPVTNICAVICANDGQCDNGNKCDGPADKKVCLNPADVSHECEDDAGCAAKTDAPICDKAAFPYKCIPKPGCASDADCLDPIKKKCDVTTKVCLACTGDGDCTGANEMCDISGTCVPKASCTDSATCFTAAAGTYCGDTAAPCQEAQFDCTADAKASGNDAWKEGFKAGKGSVIWNVQVKRLTDGVSCWDIPTGGTACADDSECSADQTCSAVATKCVPSCSTNDDCESGQSCQADAGNKTATKKGCVIGIPNGTVELKFNFFNPGGKFKTGKDDPKNSIVQLHDTGGIATEVAIDGNGTKTEGVAQFSFCDSKGSGTKSFFVKDEDGNPSNHGCYDLPSP